MSAVLVLTVVLACCAVGVVGARAGVHELQARKERAATRAVGARHNRIAQLEIELGITSPMYADPATVARAWDARFGAELGAQPMPMGVSRPPSAEEQAAIEATRARRKEVARRAAQKRMS